MSLRKSWVAVMVVLAAGAWASFGAGPQAAGAVRGPASHSAVAVPKKKDDKKLDARLAAAPKKKKDDKKMDAQLAAAPKKKTDKKQDALLASAPKKKDDKKSADLALTPPPKKKKHMDGAMLA